MLVGLDHVIVATADLDGAAAELGHALGLEVADGGRHPALGTRNRLAWWGDSYLELVTIEDPDAAARTWFGAAVATALADASAGPAGVVVASDDLDADAAVTRAAEVSAGQRTRPDGRVVRWRTARSRAFGSPGPWPLVFMIEHDRTAAEWTDAERAARATAVHPLGTPVRLRSVALGATAVTGMVGRVGRELALLFRPALAGGGARDAALGRQTLRVAPARPQEPRLTIDLEGGSTARDLDLLGCRWRLTPSG